MKKYNNSKHYSANKKKIFSLKLPFIIALIFVLLVGIVSTTLAAFLNNNSVSNADNTLIKTSVRNNKSDKAQTSAVKNVSSTSATTYYYRGSDNSWGATKMTPSTDGYYAYKQSTNNANQFKIATTTGGWDYNYSYVSKGFNSTNVQNIGDYGSDNCYCWQNGTYYILIYYPNTDINTDSKPKICASTTLPNDAPKYELYWGQTKGSTAKLADMTLSGSTATYTKTSVDNLQQFYFCIKKTVGSTSEYYGNTGNMTTTSKWTLSKGVGDCGLYSGASDTFVFSFNTSNKEVTVTYNTVYNFNLGTTRGQTSYNGRMSNDGTTLSYDLTNLNASTTYYYCIKKLIGNSETTYGNDGTMTKSNCSGWTFETNKQDCGITTTGSGTYKFSCVLSTMEVTATYPSEYTVTYKPGNYSSGSTYTQTKYQYDSLTLRGSTYTRTGYTQTAWNTNVSGTGGTNYTLSAIYSTNSALTLYPTWTINKHNITIYYIGRDGSSSYTTSSYIKTRTIVSDIDYNSSYTLSYNSYNNIDNYLLDGFSTSKSATPSLSGKDIDYTVTMGDADVVIYAYYTYNVTASIAPQSASTISLDSQVSVTATAQHGNGSYIYKYYVDDSTDPITTTSSSTSKTNTQSFSGTQLGGVGNHTVSVVISSDDKDSNKATTANIKVIPKTPEISSLEYTSPIVAGTSVSSSVSFTSGKELTGTGVYHYSCDKDGSDYIFTLNSSGAFLPTTPGDYTISVNCEDRITIGGINFDSNTSNTKNKSIVVNPKAPSITSFTYPAYKVGGNAVTPTYTISTASEYGTDPTKTIVFSVTNSPSGSTYDINPNSGSFFTETSGSYTIQMSVYVTVNGKNSETVTKTYVLNVEEATKYQVSLSTKTRDGSKSYVTSQTISPDLILISGKSTSTSGTIDVTEGNTVEVQASATVTANNKLWIFRGFMTSDGNVSISGELDNDMYKFTSGEITSATSYYACYSPEPEASCTYLGYDEQHPISAETSGTNAGKGHFQVTATAQHGSGEYYYSYSIVDESGNTVFSGSPSTSNNTINKYLYPGKYKLTYKVLSDKITVNDSFYETEKYVKQSDLDEDLDGDSYNIYVANPPADFSVSYSYTKGGVSQEITGAGTQENPYLINIGGTINLSASTTVSAQEIQYAFNDGAYSTTNTCVIDVNSITTNPLVSIVKMKYKKNNVWSAEQIINIYSFVVSNFNSGVGLQRIYNDSVLSNTWQFKVQTEVDDNYTSKILVSDTNNGPSSYSRTSSTLSFNDLFAVFDLHTLLYSGLNYFKTEVYKDSKNVFNGYNYTYVGSTSHSASKAIYFHNGISGMAFTDEVKIDSDNPGYRLMAKFNDSNNTWVTLDRLGETDYYRAYMPSGATNVTYYIMYANKFNRTTGSDYVYAASSAQTVDTTKNMFSATSISGSSISGTNIHFDGV